MGTQFTFPAKIIGSTKPQGICVIIQKAWKSNLKYILNYIIDTSVNVYLLAKACNVGYK